MHHLIKNSLSCFRTSLILLWHPCVNLSNQSAYVWLLISEVLQVSFVVITKLDTWWLAWYEVLKCLFHSKTLLYCKRNHGWKCIVETKLIPIPCSTPALSELVSHCWGFAAPNRVQCWSTSTFTEPTSTLTWQPNDQPLVPVQASIEDSAQLLYYCATRRKIYELNLF